MDLSVLQKRLREARGAPAATKPENEPTKGLIRRESECVADSRLYDLSDTALRRIGLDGAFDIEGALFLDTETTGLSGGVGTIAFLIGLGWIRSGKLYTLQLCMRDYAAEEPMLRELTEAAKPFDTIVTFNGDAFDLPLLVTRYAMTRTRCPLSALDSLDLLAPARRLWRRRLGSVRLGNLEEKILGAGRGDDLPGSEAPKRFFEYLRTGDETLLEGVMEHNRMDVCSMSSLLAELCEVYANPRAQKAAADLYSLGLALGRQGEKDEALELYRMAGVPKPLTDIAALTETRYRAQANRELAKQLRREGRGAEAEQLLSSMYSRCECGAWPGVELSKICEHERREFGEALLWAERALTLAEEETERACIEKRIARIRAKGNKHGWGGKNICP